MYARDEMAEAIVRSLKENSAEFVRKERDKRVARVRKILLFCSVFAAGVAAGALLVVVVAL